MASVPKSDHNLDHTARDLVGNLVVGDNGGCWGGRTETVNLNVQSSGAAAARAALDLIDLLSTLANDSASHVVGDVDLLGKGSARNRIYKKERWRATGKSEQ